MYVIIVFYMWEACGETLQLENLTILTILSSKGMSWIIPVLIGLLAIFLVRKLIPRAKVDVKGKYLLITGCDSGFGRETAIKLDEMGGHGRPCRLSEFTPNRASLLAALDYA